MKLSRVEASHRIYRTQNDSILKLLTVRWLVQVTGLLNLLTLWPVVLVLYFSHQETITWDCVPWAQLSTAAALSLGTNISFVLDRVEL